jgi:hypothetical protein
MMGFCVSSPQVDAARSILADVKKQLLKETG